MMRTFLPLAGLLLLAIPTVLLGGCKLVPSDRDVDEALDVYTYVTVHPDFPRSTEARPVTVYWRPSPMGAQLRMYGITERQDQDRVIEILRQGKQEYRWEAISVSFFRADSLLQAQASDDIAFRGFEELLRVETIP
jgi:hypothetical protein